MYDELVKRIKIFAQWVDKGLRIPPSICLEAADAIEALSAEVLGYKAILQQYGGETGIKNLQEYANKYWDLLQKTHRLKPKCTECCFYGVNTQSDEAYCLHPIADERQIFWTYPQQRSPEWCPIVPKEET